MDREMPLYEAWGDYGGWGDDQYMFADLMASSCLPLVMHELTLPLQQHYQRQLEMDTALNEQERLRRWEERLRWEELDEAERSMRYRSMDPYALSSLGLSGSFEPFVLFRRARHSTSLPHRRILGPPSRRKERSRPRIPSQPQPHPRSLLGALPLPLCSPPQCVSSLLAALSPRSFAHSADLGRRYMPYFSRSGLRPYAGHGGVGLGGGGLGRGYGRGMMRQVPPSFGSRPIAGDGMLSLREQELRTRLRIAETRGESLAFLPTSLGADTPSPLSLIDSLTHRSRRRPTRSSTQRRPHAQRTTPQRTTARAHHRPRRTPNRRSRRCERGGASTEGDPRRQGARKGVVEARADGC